MTRIQADLQPEQLQELPETTPMTAEQAFEWRKLNPPLSLWRVVWFQAFVGILVSLAVYLVTLQLSLVASVAYGALCVVLPSVLLARALSSSGQQHDAGVFAVRFFVWEGVKIASTLVMLVLVPKVVQDANWPLVLLGLVVTLKVNLVVLAKRNWFIKKNFLY
jgi:ATP synthase protein I